MTAIINLLQERGRTLRAQAAVLAALSEDCECAGEALIAAAERIDDDFEATETEVARAESIIADVREKMERAFNVLP